MTTYTLDGSSVTNAKTKHGDDDTYNVSHNHTLNLVNGGTATVGIGFSSPFAFGDLDTFNLVGRPGSVTNVILGQVRPMPGTISLNNATLHINSWSHTSWNNTGTSVFAHGSTATTGNITGGTIDIESGSSLALGGYYSSLIELNGGSFSATSFFGTHDITFESQSKQNPDSVTIPGITGADHWTMTAADLTIFNSTDQPLLSVWNLTNHTNQPFQVDQLATGVSIVADSTPRPGMIPFHA